MSLLLQIQESVVDENSSLGPIMLKLRLLASRLGSDVLEEWVKYESEGYPQNAVVPEYRETGVMYTGTFYGPGGSGIKNAPIPDYHIQKHAGEHWSTYQIRESIGTVDEMIKRGGDDGHFGIDASNLMLLLQGKIYKGLACNQVSAEISSAAFYGIKQSVRSKILELSIALEQSTPGAAHISFGHLNNNSDEKKYIQQFSQQIIYGDVTTAISSGSDSNVGIQVVNGDSLTLLEYLTSAGIGESDAKDLTEIMESESPENLEEPFGERAKLWIASNLKKAADGTWKIGFSAATKVITEAALKYYGLK